MKAKLLALLLIFTMTFVFASTEPVTDNPEKEKVEITKKEGLKTINALLGLKPINLKTKKIISTEYCGYTNSFGNRVEVEETSSGQFLRYTYFDNGVDIFWTVSLPYEGDEAFLECLHNSDEFLSDIIEGN